MLDDRRDSRWFSQWRDLYAHPYSPAGGSGPGASCRIEPVRNACSIYDLPDPDSPAALYLDPVALYFFGDGVKKTAAPAGAQASTFSLSKDAKTLLKGIEKLRLKPYNDQTGKEITAWVQGATIGYGHLIKSGEWNTYKSGITQAGADALFDTDSTPFVSAVQGAITANITQNQFDAMVILAYNIGAAGFKDSAVAKLVNDPKASTDYKDLESAWKAWNKSQGKVMPGLDNRRQCEWDIYSSGVYKSW